MSGRRWFERPLRTGRLTFSGAIVATIGVGYFSCAGPASIAIRVPSEVPERFVVTAEGSASPRDLALVGAAAGNAVAALQGTGFASSTVEIEVVPSREALAEQTGHRAPWLLAWSTAHHVWIVAPSTWVRRTSPIEDVVELLTHELAHCAVFQAIGAIDGAAIPLPFWLREGSASFAAHQDYRWATLEDLARRHDRTSLAALLESDAGDTPSAFAESYGAAHHAYAYFLKRYGRAGELQLFQAVANATPFENAFLQTTGISHSAFLREFSRRVVWRAFRRTTRNHQLAR